MNIIKNENEFTDIGDEIKLNIPFKCIGIQNSLLEKSDYIRRLDF